MPFSSNIIACVRMKKKSRRHKQFVWQPHWRTNLCVYLCKTSWYCMPVKWMCELTKAMVISFHFLVYIKTWCEALILSTQSARLTITVYDISRTLAGNKIVHHWDVAGASLVGAAPTTSSFSTQYQASIAWEKTTASRDEKQFWDLEQLILEIWRYFDHFS